MNGIQTEDIQFNSWNSLINLQFRFIWFRREMEKEAKTTTTEWVNEVEVGIGMHNERKMDLEQSTCGNYWIKEWMIAGRQRWNLIINWLTKWRNQNWLFALFGLLHSVCYSFQFVLIWLKTFSQLIKLKSNWKQTSKHQFIIITVMRWKQTSIYVHRFIHIIGPVHS